METGIFVVDEGGARLVGLPELDAASEAGIVHLGRFLSVPDGRWVTVRAGGDGYVASIPSSAFTSGAELEVASRRLVVHGGSTLCWNVKDVRRVEVGDDRLPDSVPERPPH